MDEIQDLQLSSGDLVPSGRGFATVTGVSYLRQRIAMALQVPYGSDPYNPQWGSVLPGYIGRPQTAATTSLVSSETARVLQQLIAAQQALTRQVSITGSVTPYGADDIIASVDSVSAVRAPADPETMQVSLALTTLSGQQITVSRTLGS